MGEVLCPFCHLCSWIVDTVVESRWKKAFSKKASPASIRFSPCITFNNSPRSTSAALGIRTQQSLPVSGYLSGCASPVIITRARATLRLLKTCPVLREDMALFVNSKEIIFQMLRTRAYFWDLRWFLEAPADWGPPRKQPKSWCTMFDLHFLSGWWKTSSRHHPSLLPSKHSASANFSHFQCALTIAQVQALFTIKLGRKEEAAWWYVIF